MSFTRSLLNLQRDTHLNNSEKVGILKTQMKDFINSDIELKDKIGVGDTYYLKTIEYLNKAEVNQMENNRYLVIDQLINTKKTFNEYRKDNNNFKEKKKYLKKSGNKVKTLKKYITNMDEGKKKYFLWYLEYGGNKEHIYIVNSVLGYRYKGVIELYIHIFQKEHKTAEQKEFLLHSTILTSYITDSDLEYIANKI